MVYAYISNGKAERMVRSIKIAVKKMVVGQGMDCEESLPNVLYVYHHLRLSSGAPPFVLTDEVVSRVESSDAVALISNASENHRRLELPANVALWARRRDDQELVLTNKVFAECSRFNFGDGVLIVHWAAF